MIATKTKINVERTLRDGEILLFIWRWKLTTTLSIAARFFGDRSPHSAYKRLRRLQKAGFIQRKCDENGTNYLWSLTTKGFAAVRHRLPQLKDEGFKSETFEHDFYCSAFQLGDWLKGVPKDTAIFSEQELRRLHLSVYPEWVPKTDLHRSDGYSKILVDGKWAVIAFEVELTHKEDSRYDILAKFYDREPGIYRVLWLVETETSARYIQKRLLKSVSNRCMVHDFVSKADFIELGWKAPILLGFEAKKTVSFLMNSNLGTACNHVPSLFLLDGRRTPYRSPSYPFSEKTEKCDRVGPYRIAYSPSDSSINNLPPTITPSLLPPNDPEGSAYSLSNRSQSTTNQGGN